VHHVIVGYINSESKERQFGYLPKGREVYGYGYDGIGEE